MPSWPSSIKASLGMTDEIVDPSIRTTVDVGPAKVRRRFTATIRNVDVPITCNGTDRATLDAFFDSSCEGGSLTFTWTDPVDESSATYRWRAPLKWTLVRGHATATLRLWQTVAQLEMQP